MHPGLGSCLDCVRASEDMIKIFIKFPTLGTPPGITEFFIFSSLLHHQKKVKFEFKDSSMLFSFDF